MNPHLFSTEDEFVRWLQKLVGQAHLSEKGRRRKNLKVGIGDDAALIHVKARHDLLLTTDMSIEGAHFISGLHPPEAVGHRALARSLSDVAAMGGVPRYALVSLAISKGLSRQWVSKFYQGLLTLAHRFGVELAGGDTALIQDRIFVDVLVAGEAPRGRALLRSGARTGDLIYVSGRLGLSALGLRLLRNQRGSSRLPAKAEAKEALHRHLYPEPQCALGSFLSERRLASALMDLSDGLSTDLTRLCAASNVGARLWAAKIPGPEMPEAADSLQLALHGGEDYQLLFTVPPRKVPRLPSRFQGQVIYQIGEIVSSKGLKLVSPDGGVQTLRPAGWDHFEQL